MPPRKPKRSFEVGDKLLLPVEVTMILPSDLDPDYDLIVLQVPGKGPMNIQAKWLLQAIEEG